MSGTQVFSGRVVALTLAGAVVVFALSMILSLTAPPNGPGVGSDTQSISALGYAGLCELLQRDGFAVARSEIDGVVRPANDDLLVMAEPSLRLAPDDVLRLDQAKRALLILPKRTGTADAQASGWLDSTEPLPIEEATDVASLVGPKIEVARVASPTAWSTNALGVEPSLDETVQVMRGGGLTPLIANGDDILVATYGDQRHLVWIVSDPDFLENAGFAKGQNPALIEALFKRLTTARSTLIFDDVIHGIVHPTANPLRAMLQFPLVIGLGAVLLAAALLLWGTMRRFGGASVSPPSVDFGRRRLITTSASLLDRGGHQTVVMARYVELTLHDIGTALHLRRDPSDADLAEAIDRLAAARGIDTGVAASLARAHGLRHATGRAVFELFAAVGDIYRYRKEISDGTSGYRDPR